jgi:hypothetical protein
VTILLEISRENVANRILQILLLHAVKLNYPLLTEVAKVLITLHN